MIAAGTQPDKSRGEAGMREIKAKYGIAQESILITLNALADDAYRESHAIDNKTDRFLDALVQLQVNVTAGAPAGDKNCLIYAYGGARGGAPFSGGATGMDAGFGSLAGQLISNCPLLGIVTLDAQTEVFTSDVFSMATAFGGVLPEEWGIIVMNQAGQVLASASNKAWYQGVKAEG